MRKIAAAAAAGIALAGLGLSPLPAQAETCLPGTSLCQGGRLIHVNDPGYDPAIIIFCNYGDAFTTGGNVSIDWTKDKLVHEGTTSNADCGDDTDVIYLRVGEELWCQYSTAWHKQMDSTGPHKIDDLWEHRCELRKD